PGEGPVWLDDVTCRGWEAELQSCPARTWGENNCHHGEDAGVRCAGECAQVRLVNGSSRCVGRVEVLHQRRWGLVCDDTWDMADAQVICRSLGCGSALAAPGHAHFGQGAGPIWLDGTHCTGEELTLARCALHTWGEHNCGHSEDAGAICS
ncbi:DMBT1 protein, partial [Rhodinocichla rosea]|nr:DMBT1 protein [Rhodinocichla rosea]